MSDGEAETDVERAQRLRRILRDLAQVELSEAKALDVVRAYERR